MATGTIKKIVDETKPYRFIANDDGQGDVFAHESAFEAGKMSEFKEGDKVSFELGDQTDKGPRAKEGSVKRV